MKLTIYVLKEKIGWYYQDSDSEWFTRRLTVSANEARDWEDSSRNASIRVFDTMQLEIPDNMLGGSR